MQKTRIWESDQLSSTLSVLLQMRHALEVLAEKVGAVSLADLPPSMIPTQTLYEVSYYYELMYDKLMEYDLLNTGNKQTQSKGMH